MIKDKDKDKDKDTDKEVGEAQSREVSTRKKARGGG